VSDDHKVVPEPDPVDDSPAETRPGRARPGAVEFVVLSGTAGDELDARQNAAIREVLMWLHRQREQSRNQ
jgi:hypothetical protein